MIAAAAVVIALTAGPAVTDVTPLSDDKTTQKIVVPQSPGLQSAERVCKEGAIQSREAMVEPPDGRIEYVAELGPDLLYWVDSGNNRNALLNGQGIVLNDEVLRCFRASR